MAEITRNEFYKKYGECVVSFSSYYKYKFTYKGKLDGANISCDFGGDADEIYRFELTNNKSIELIELAPFSGEARDGNGDILDSFYDY